MSGEQMIGGPGSTGDAQLILIVDGNAGDLGDRLYLSASSGFASDDSTRLVPLRQRVESSRRTLEAYYGQYDLGRRSLFDLLDTQNELFRSSVKLVDGNFAVLLGHHRLLFTMGRLLQSLGIEPATG